MRLLKQYQQLHSRGKFPGRSIKPIVPEIARLVQEYQAQTLLDYGCGQGKQYGEHGVHKIWGILPTLYDPASKAYWKKPEGHFDGVICTDVLEHIPEEELDDVLKDIFQYALKFVVFSISTAPSQKTFGDGGNLHVTQKPDWWWLAKIAEFATVPFRARFH